MLTVAYTPAAVARAEVDSAAAQARGDDNFGSASTVRVGKVLASVAKDPEAKIGI